LHAPRREHSGAALSGDPVGSHIKGLLLSYLHYFWPGLVSAGDGPDGFVQQFITPIIKARPKRSGKPKVRRATLIFRTRYLKARTAMRPCP
jgi:hypothetical protein